MCSVVFFSVVCHGVSSTAGVCRCRQRGERRTLAPVDEPADFDNLIPAEREEEMMRVWTLYRLVIVGVILLGVLLLCAGAAIPLLLFEDIIGGGVTAEDYQNIIVLSFIMLVYGSSLIFYFAHEAREALSETRKLKSFESIFGIAVPTSEEERDVWRWHVNNILREKASQFLAACANERLRLQQIKQGGTAPELAEQEQRGLELLQQKVAETKQELREAQDVAEHAGFTIERSAKKLVSENSESD